MHPRLEGEVGIIDASPSPGPQSGIPSRIGIWVASDGEDLGRALFAHVVRRELQRRLPASTVRCFGSDPYMHPQGLDGGEPLEPLGDWSRERAADLADQLDCVIVGGGDVLSRRAVADSQPRDDRATPGGGSLSSLLISGLGGQLERGCPVMWLAANLPIEPTPEEAATLRSTMARMPYHSVRDENSKHRLKAAGVDQGVTVVPDPTLLVARHFDPEALGKRLEYLRLMGWYPSRGRALVLQGDGDLMSFVPALGRHVARLFQAQDDMSVVVADLPSSRGSEAFAGALLEVLLETGAGRSYLIPSEVAVVDHIAALSAASGFIGTSLQAGIAAMAFGRPFVALNLDRRFDNSRLGPVAIRAPLVEKVEGVTEPFERMDATEVGPELATLREDLDRHLDRIAEIAVEAGVRRGRMEKAHGGDPEAMGSLVRTAHEVLSRRLAVERTLFADMAASDRAEVARLVEEVARLEANVGALERQLQGLESRRILRYSAPLLSLYGKLRKWFGLQP